MWPGLDQTLKGLTELVQEQVDKAIALGLIDVRDIEEVGTGPLMEELGLDEATAEKIVAKCASEAKIVAAEQEAKKSAEAKKKAADRAAFEGGPRSASASDSPNARCWPVKPKQKKPSRQATMCLMQWVLPPVESPETIVHDESLLWIPMSYRPRNRPCMASRSRRQCPVIFPMKMPTAQPLWPKAEADHRCD